METNKKATQATKPAPKQAPATNTSSSTTTGADGLSTQHTIPIAEIRDNVVVLKDGSFRIVIEAKAVNFELMNLEERESVEYSYKAFLNSLYFPVQIHIQSRRVDAEDYLKKLEGRLKNQQNMLLSMLTSDYLDFLAQLLETTDIVDKNFYIIVPYYSTELDKETALNTSKNLFSKLWYLKKKPTPLTISHKSFEQAKQELRYRLQTVQEGLRQCGVQTALLNTSQLIDLYYKFYNTQIGPHQTTPGLADITAPVINKQPATGGQREQKK